MDILEIADALQLCAGRMQGVNAMRSAFTNESTETVLLALAMYAISVIPLIDVVCDCEN